MTAAVISATMAQQSNVKSAIISGGTERRLKRLYLAGTKAAQSDWFLLSSYLSTAECNNIFSIHPKNEATGNAYTVSAFTYDGTDYKVILTGAETGTSTVDIVYFTG